MAYAGVQRTRMSILLYLFGMATVAACWSSVMLAVARMP
jgi:hypothetical protein